MVIDHTESMAGWISPRGPAHPYLFLTLLSGGQELKDDSLFQIIKHTKGIPCALRSFVIYHYLMIWFTSHLRSSVRIAITSHF